MAESILRMDSADQNTTARMLLYNNGSVLSNSPSVFLWIDQILVSRRKHIIRTALHLEMENQLKLNIVQSLCFNIAVIL